MAIDRTTGALYVVWQDASFSGVDEIAFSMSTDNGQTWSMPIKVNQTPRNTTTPANQQAFVPGVHVTPNGTVAVTYYDFRNNTASPGVWTFEHPDEGPVRVTVPSVLRTNNADIFDPLLARGLGLALQPDFLVWRQIADRRLEVVLPDWTAPASALQLVTPPSTLRPRRVQALIDFLARRLAGAPWAATPV